MPALIMLGPQNQQLNLRAALDLLGIASRVGVITAGWRDAEGDIKELEVHIGRPVIDLMLYQRANEVFARDEPFFRAHRERQNRIKELQRLYRLRLRPMSAAAYSLLSTESDSHLLRSHERAAIAQIRALDRQHLKLIQGLHEAFEREWRPSERPGLTDHRESLEQAVAACDALLIAGGHVAVLMNRMRLFGMKELLRDRAIIAWSAGAMVLGERIVVFHDHAPQGRRDAEILDAGLGIKRNVLPLPYADRRLDWNDRKRLGLLARRFAPTRCITLNSGSVLHFQDGRIASANNASSLRSNGRLRVVRAE